MRSRGFLGNQANSFSVTDTENVLFSFVSFSIFHIGLVMETKFLYCRNSSNCFYSAQGFSFILHSCEALLTQFETFEIDTSFVAAVVISNLNSIFLSSSVSQRAV